MTANRSSMKGIWVAIGGLAGLIAIVGLGVAIVQLLQAWIDSRSQDVTQATMIAIMDAQLGVQAEIATAQASEVESGPTATAIAQTLVQLQSTQEALEAERQRLELTLTAVVANIPPEISPSLAPAVTPTADQGDDSSPVICPQTIDFGQTIQCSIDAATEIDTYTFEAGADDRLMLRITRTSETLQPWVKVFAPDDALVCERYSDRLVDLVNCVVPRSGVYKIQLADSSRNKTEIGDYTLYLQRLNGPRNGQTIDFGETLFGTIQRPTEIDTYMFEGEVDDKLLIRLTRASETFQPWIRLYAPDGTLACERHEERLADMANCILPRSGTYSILVSDASRSRTETGDYSLYLQRLNNPGQSIPITSGETLSGIIDWATEIDTYTFEGQVDDKVLVRSTRTAETMQPWIRVFEPNGTLSCEAYDARLAERTCTLPRSGVYTVLVSDASRSRTETGGYTLYMSRL